VADEQPALDMSERGRRNGRPISLNRRLFMKFTALRGCHGGLMAELQRQQVQGALYLDANDAKVVGVLAMAEDPAYFVTELRRIFSDARGVEHLPEFDMLGRTYSIGYESDLEEALFARPRGRILDPDNRWAIWYPLQRSKAFYRLPQDRQRQILAEHGGVGRRYGEAGLAADVRLACHGLDRNDNDFVIGLLGAELHPLSKVVQEMRATEQTAQYLDRLGPFFVGHVAWQSSPPR
jgi:chlorite dismutase